MFIKKLFSFLLLILVVSCSTLDSSKIAPGYKEAFDSIKLIVFGDNSRLFNYEDINKIPYASILLKIGKGPEGLLILESENKGKSTWVSADDVRFLMQDGRITQTSGLNNNLTDLIFPDSVQGLPQETQNFIIYYSYDFPFLSALKVKISRKYLGKVKVNLASGPKELHYVEEVIHNKEIGWRANNKYWLDEENFVWKSEQQISPKLPNIKYEVTKKPS